jgi:hypothetical protein
MHILQSPKHAFLTGIPTSGYEKGYKFWVNMGIFFFVNINNGEVLRPVPLKLTVFWIFPHFLGPSSTPSSPGLILKR